MILVSELPPRNSKRCNMIPAKNADEAMEIAFALKGEEAKVVVIPDGVSVLVVAQ